MNRRCVAVLGGSFDPVHVGHVALSEYFGALLSPDELRIIPTGNPGYRQELQTSAEQRIAMLRLAFGTQSVPVVIDPQEIRRSGKSYTIDTLRALRAELGPQTSIAFLLGADQLQKLDSWKEWRSLFDYAHLCAASRPGFSIEAVRLPEAVAREFTRRSANAEQIRNTPNGLTYLASNLAVEVSATQIRSALQRGEHLQSQLPAGVLDYIEQHHLYRANGH